MPISKEYFSGIGSFVKEWLQTPSGQAYAKQYGDAFDAAMVNTRPTVTPDLLSRIREYAEHCDSHATEMDLLLASPSVIYRQLATDMTEVVRILSSLPLYPPTPGE